MTLQQKYTSACNEYIAEFCKKQDMDFNGWIGDQVGGIAECNDFYFDFHDIVWDVNSKQPVGDIITWYYDNLESENSINYYSYTKGLRIAELAPNKSKLKELMKDSEELGLYDV